MSARVPRKRRKRDFRNYMAGLHKQAEQQIEGLFERAVRKITTSIDSLYDDPYKKSTYITGRMREDALFHVLDNTIGYGGRVIVRSDAQRDFHRLMFFANIEHIYKDDLAANIANIRERHDVTGDFKPIVAIMSFRRGGKTTGLTMFAQAFAIAVEEIIQNLFSTGSRASELALNLVYAFLCSYDNGSWIRFIESKNKETIRIKVSPNDTRVFNALPSDAKISSINVFICLCVCVHVCYSSSSCGRRISPTSTICASVTGSLSASARSSTM